MRHHLKWVGLIFILGSSLTSYAQDSDGSDNSDSSDSSGAPANIPSQKESPILDAGNYSVPEYPQNN
jgi:hypothetical protein